MNPTLALFRGGPARRLRRREGCAGLRGLRPAMAGKRSDTEPRGGGRPVCIRGGFQIVCGRARPLPVPRSAHDRVRRRGSWSQAAGTLACHGRLLRRGSKAPLARHLTDCLGETPGPGGGGVSARVPELRWRHPAQRRRPAGAGSLRTGGSQAGEGQDGFARVKSDSHTSRRTARATTSLAGPGTAHRLGRVRAGPRRARRLPGVARRTARDRHSQPLSRAGRAVKSKPCTGDPGDGLRRGEKIATPGEEGCRSRCR